MAAPLVESKRWPGSEWIKDRPLFLELGYRASKALLKSAYPLVKRINRSAAERFFVWSEEVIKGYVFNCQMCGQCTLHSTGMTCPMTCPKSLRNGPCGGVRANGNCEVIPDMPCVWVQAWERSLSMTIYGDEIHTLQPPVNRQLQGDSSWLNMLDGADTEMPPGWVPLSELEVSS